MSGSTGQPVTNPAFAEAMALERACVVLEDRYGLSIKARASLSLSIGEPKVTAADLKWAAAQETDDTIDGDLLEEWT